MMENWKFPNGMSQNVSKYDKNDVFDYVVPLKKTIASFSKRILKNLLLSVFSNFNQLPKNVPFIENEAIALMNI